MAMVLIDKEIIDKVVRDLEVVKMHLEYLPETLRDLTVKLSEDIEDIRKNIVKSAKIEKR